MTTTIPLLIDTDPGVDDALALLMAFADPGHAVVGLTVTAGNVGLGHTLANALKLCEVCGRGEVPVHAGCAEPLLHPAPDAAHVHGADGFGDAGYAPASARPQPEHAALAILRLSHEHAGTLVLVALGPLTNIALALKLDPTLPDRIARLVVMGGAVTGHGNITAAAEFNLYFDPEAAALVFRGFPRVDLCDWEVVVAHGLDRGKLEGWLQGDSAECRFYRTISQASRVRSEGGPGRPWHCADALAMAFALQPQGAVEVVEHRLEIALGGAPSRGSTVVDWEGRGQAGGASVRMLMRYDHALFEDLIQGALRGRDGSLASQSANG